MKNPNTEPTTAPRSLAELLQRGDLFAAKCPSREVLKHVTSRWGVLLLVGLLSGTHRFSDLRRKVNGISEKMLAQTLQWLESDGFVERIAYPVVPPHVEYRLTPLGQEIGKKVESLADWIEANLSQILAAKRAKERPAPRVAAQRGSASGATSSR